MSQITFSHQFPQRWLIAPQPIKNAIFQELDDIVRLLDNDTALENFEFAAPDLRLYIDTVYEDIAKDLKHKQRVEKSQRKQVKPIIEETRVKGTNETNHDNRLNNTETVDSPVAISNIETDISSAMPDSMPSHIDSSNKDKKTNRVTIDETFMHELEMRIDDYLTEQLSNMSENLKSWLRDEVKQYTKDK